MNRISVHMFTSDPTKAWEMLRVKQEQVTLPVKPPDAPVADTSVRFVCISDTHARTSSMDHPIPPGDVLIHAGDITNRGHPKEISEFNNFLGRYLNI